MMESLEVAMPDEKVRVSHVFTNEGLLEREYWHVSINNKRYYCTTRDFPAPEILLRKILSEIETPEQKLESMKKEMGEHRVKAEQLSGEVKRMTLELARKASE